MADPLGFMKYKRVKHPYRPVEERKRDWNRNADSILVPSENSCEMYGLWDPVLP